MRSQFIILFFSGILILFPAFVVQANAPLSEDAIEFLKENKQEIDLENAQESFSVLEPYLDENEFFFCGELHGVGVNEEIRFEVLKYLHQNAGVRYYVIEGTFSIAHYLNEYLKTGDEYYLDVVIPYWHRTYDIYEYFENLHEYNQTLPRHERIEIIGFDITGPSRNIISVIHLFEVLPFEDVPSEIKNPLSELKDIKDEFMERRKDPDHYYEAQTCHYAGFSGDFYDQMLPPVEEIHEFIEEESETLEHSLGDEFDDLKFIIRSIIKGFEQFELVMDKGSVASYEYREKNSFQNFKEIYPDLNRGKFFGQWGDWHVFQDDFRGIPWLATYLTSEDSPLSGDVYSIYLVYSDSQILQTSSPDEPFDFDTEIRDMDELKNLTETELTFFDLQGYSSPFAEELYFMKDHACGDTTLGYFQALLLIQNSGPARALYGNR